MSEAFGSTAADGGRSRERTPAWPLLGMGAARGFARRRGVLQINRNGTGRTRRRGGMLGQGQGNLQEATSPDEIIRKMRSQRIAPPRGAGDTVAALANQRVIEQRHHPAGGREGFPHSRQSDPPKSLGSETLAFQQTIAPRPLA